MLEQKLAFYREHQDEYNSLKSQGLDDLEIDRRLRRPTLLPARAPSIRHLLPQLQLP